LSDFAHWSTDRRQRLETTLDTLLPAADHLPARLHEAMRYAAKGGKRFRALLIYAAGEAIEATTAALDVPAAAVELIHAYSLVHDDLPAMDNDELRRGLPTVHKAWDEATAILTGDALQTLAFRALACHGEALDAEARIRMVALLAEASGSRGMCGGQAIDLGAIGQQLSLAELEAMHIHKTGALIRACLLMAAQAGKAPAAEQLAALDRYGKCLGLAFQIQDDLLDEEGDPQDIGKTRGKDRAAGKPTFPSILGGPASRQRAAELFADAEAALLPFAARGDRLRALLDQIRQRRA
jgi:geranylgeranyl pyrophosphate synthase